MQIAKIPDLVKYYLLFPASFFLNQVKHISSSHSNILISSNCPKSTEGTPPTLTELKIYSQLLDWKKHPICLEVSRPLA